MNKYLEEITSRGVKFILIPKYISLEKVLTEIVIRIRKSVPYNCIIKLFLGVKLIEISFKEINLNLLISNSIYFINSIIIL